MVAEDLRRGNIVKHSIYKDKTIKVDSVEEGGINLYASAYGGLDEAYNWNEIEGLSINQEILLKCGFEKYHVFENSDFMLQIKRSKEYRKFNDLTISLADGRCTFNIYPSVDVEYLHQAQNLYFALTGKELEIKL